MVIDSEETRVCSELALARLIAGHYLAGCGLLTINLNNHRPRRCVLFLRWPGPLTLLFSSDLLVPSSCSKQLAS